MDMEFEKYKVLLASLIPALDAHFENQKEYIKCKIRCSHCCQKGYYPVTRPEAKLMKEGFQKLAPALQEEITQKAGQLTRQRDEFIKEGNELIKFKYCCPFLTDDKCSIYEHRPMICRMQGLLKTSISGGFDMPACVYIGLNYANIYDEKNKYLSDEKIAELNLKERPSALGFSYEYLVGALGFNINTLSDNLADPKNDEIRMIFEWVGR